MASIPYLTGGESPTAALMNKVFTDAGISLDAKLSKLLHGKSFFLAQTSQVPARLCGKAFFFTSGTAVYASRVPGYIDAGSGVARPYNHTQFTDAVTELLGYFDWLTSDNVNKVITVPAWWTDPYYYQGLPYAWLVGFLDWSLQAHTIDAVAVVGSPTINAAGTGYVVNNVLTLVGGSGSLATVKVTAINGSGGITGLQLLNAGVYNSAPSSPVNLTGGAGTGGKVNAAFASQTFYLKETATVDVSAGGPPEKKYHFALAEIIIEGPTSVTLPASYDKYNCFRLHNLNNAAATVTFTGGTTVNLAPLECATVRRLSPTTSYRVRQGSYFFAFEAGDPRAYWFLPKTSSVNLGGEDPVAIGDGGAVTNSHQANNLMNPAIALDWANYLTRDFTISGGVDPASVNGWFAGWNQDASVQCDIGAFYTTLFGDPSNPATKLGDLIHHKGNIIIVRSSRTANDPVTGKPVLTFDSVTFNGYATIVADFAAKQLGVTVNGSGNYVITNSDAANKVTLIPIGTNLFKTGDALPTLVNLNNHAGTSTPFTIEAAVFEAPDYNTLSATSPQLIFHPTLTNASNTRDYGDLYAAGGTPWTIVAGDPTRTLNWDVNRSTAKTINGIHNVTVGDLLTMDWWGDPAKAGQSTQYVDVFNRQLRFTPEGLVLSYRERRSTITPGPSTQYNDWAVLKHGLPNARAIKFRGNGWGFYSATEGSRASAWLSPRKGRFQVGTVYNGDAANVDGADFTLNNFSATESSIKLLGRIKTTRVGLAARDARFWQCTQPGDYLAGYFEHRRIYTDQEFGVLWDGYYSYNNVAGIQPASLPAIAMALLPEMYNALARSVNAITRGVQLSWKTLRWNVSGAIVGLGRYPGAAGIANPINGNTANISGAGSTYPVPVDCFAAFESGSQFESLCTLLGIPVLSAADFPGGLDTTNSEDPNVDFTFFQTKKNHLAVFYDYISGSARDVVVTDDGVNSRVTGTADLTITSERLSSAAILAGTATGSRCVGTYARGSPDYSGLGNHKYKVANNGSGYLLFNDDGFPSEFACNPTAAGQAICHYPGATTFDLQSTSGHPLFAFRWCRIAAVQEAIEETGFDFGLLEAFVPLSLEYFLDASTPSVSSASGSVNIDTGVVPHGVAYWNAYGAHHVSAGYFGRVGLPSPYFGGLHPGKTIGEIAAALNSASGESHRSETVPGFYGALVKFCGTDDAAKAKWKLYNTVQYQSVPPMKVGFVTEFPERFARAPVGSASLRVFERGDFYYTYHIWDSTTLDCTISNRDVFWESYYGLSKRPTGNPNPVLDIEYTLAEGAENLFQVPLTEGSQAPQLSPIAVQCAFTNAGDLATIPAMLVSYGLWLRQRGWAQLNADNFLASATDDQYVPWQWQAAAPLDYDFAPENGLTILSRDPNLDEAALAASYQCLFDLSQPTIKLGDPVAYYGVGAGSNESAAGGWSAASGY